MSVGSELADLFQQDQGDRASYPVDFRIVGPRDRERKARVLELLGEGAALQPEDLFHAAVILLHGPDSSDYQMSLNMLRRAVEIDSSFAAAKEMIAFAQDRYLLSLGKPQWYGTQKEVRGGRVVLAPLDTEAVTDEDRRRLGVLSLAERHEEIARINAMMQVNSGERK